MVGAGGNSGGGNLFGGSVGVGGGLLQEEPSCEGMDPTLDNDGDGWTGVFGDCNDCTVAMNPGAQDYAGNGIDEDCNGTPDDTPTNCDGALDVASNDPVDGARAIGICKMADGERWGLISAEYILADGKPLATLDPGGIGHGILTAFGPNVKPQEGASVLALSSGTARQPSDPGFGSPANYDKSYSSGAPPGYPKKSPACPNVIAGEPHDSVGLRLRLKAPTNAKSLSFDLNFYTYEFPHYICDIYNDFFVAMLKPVPLGQSDGNISYDTLGNTISVNAGFLQVCHPQDASSGVYFDCPLGPAELVGTGFDVDPFGNETTNSAATGWLKTSTLLANPGQEITLDFAIWDSADGLLDSTVLIDNFHFGLTETPTQTEPIADPK